jgi:hypothetical protein
MEKANLIVFDWDLSYYPKKITDLVELKLVQDGNNIDFPKYSGIIFHALDSLMVQYLKEIRNYERAIIQYRVPESEYNTLKRDFPVMGIFLKRFYFAGDNKQLEQKIRANFLVM